MEKKTDILRDSILLAKETGLWQKFNLKEKKETVRYFYLNFRTITKDRICHES